jgi:hypothetical protein
MFAGPSQAVALPWRRTPLTTKQIACRPLERKRPGKPKPAGQGTQYDTSRSWEGETRLAARRLKRARTSEPVIQAHAYGVEVGLRMRGVPAWRGEILIAEVDV